MVSNVTMGIERGTPSADGWKLFTTGTCWQSFLRSFQRPCAPLTLQRGAMHADGTRVKKEDNQCSATIEVFVGLAV